MLQIILDNGHGVKTPGKCSPDGSIREWAYTREIVKRIASSLKARGVSCHILVPEDADISLGQRAMRANAICDLYGKKNCLLISVHLNAAGNGEWMSGRGWEAWTSPGTTGADVWAERLYTSAKKHLPAGTKIRTDMSDGDSDKEARFAILTQTKCAAVLTENLFQDKREDVAYLLSEEGKRAITELHVDAILEGIK